MLLLLCFVVATRGFEKYFLVSQGFMFSSLSFRGALSMLLSALGKGQGEHILLKFECFGEAIWLLCVQLVVMKDGMIWCCQMFLFAVMCGFLLRGYEFDVN